MSFIVYELAKEVVRLSELNRQTQKDACSGTMSSPQEKPSTLDESKLENFIELLQSDLDTSIKKQDVTEVESPKWQYYQGYKTALVEVMRGLRADFDLYDYSN